MLAGLLALVVASVAPGQPSALADSNATEEAALLVYEINRARWDPGAFEQESRIDMAATLPAPPLAWNPLLGASGSFKAEEMARYSYFAHQSPVTGMWPNELVRTKGYPLPAVFTDHDNNVESLFVGGYGALEALRAFTASPPHRDHLFGQGWFAAHLEIGAGRSSGASYWAVHTAYRDSPVVFLTGVVYRDLDGDGRMDAGEGLGGVRVTAGSQTTVTTSGGSWSISVASGRFLVRVGGGGGFDGPSWTTVVVDRWNVGIEFVSGQSRPTVRSYQLCAGRPPTILGTAGDDVLVGTPGADVIHGLAGDDVIDGLGGGDLVCGGPGDDVLRGRSGADLLYGQGGADLLVGGGSWDRLRGGAGVDECVGGEATWDCERSSG